jgi:hypothetical protein
MPAGNRYACTEASAEQAQGQVSPVTAWFSADALGSRGPDSEWGSEFSEDGSQTRCRNCEDGVSFFTGGECTDCSSGWEDALYGYSCCSSAEDTDRTTST